MILAGAARLFGHTVGWPGSLAFAGGANYLVIVSQLASSSLTILVLYRVFCYEIYYDCVGCLMV